LADDALVERDRLRQAGVDLVLVLLVAGPLLVERREPEHLVRRVLRVRIGARILGDELLVLLDGLLAGVGEHLALGRDLRVERGQDAALAVLVMVLHDARDGAAVVLRGLLVLVGLLLQLGEGGELIRRRRRQALGLGRAGR